MTTFAKTERALARAIVRYQTAVEETAYWSLRFLAQHALTAAPTATHLVIYESDQDECATLDASYLLRDGVPIAEQQWQDYLEAADENNWGLEEVSWNLMWSEYRSHFWSNYLTDYNNSRDEHRKIDLANVMAGR